MIRSLNLPSRYEAFNDISNAKKTEKEEATLTADWSSDSNFGFVIFANKTLRMMNADFINLRVCLCLVGCTSRLHACVFNFNIVRLDRWLCVIELWFAFLPPSTTFSRIESCHLFACVCMWICSREHRKLLLLLLLIVAQWCHSCTCILTASFKFKADSIHLGPLLFICNRLCLKYMCNSSVVHKKILF